ncbi:MAG TPA: phytanoyl-CoA dioxygenase, partial [Paraburkholderia sp.]|nr:phytanoyl-CoA dioxygenase [Paraburkholderia sp.]
MTETIQQRVARAVTDDLVRDFHVNGAVRIRNIFSADELAMLREAIDRNIADPSPRAKVASRPDDPGWFFEDFCNW